MADAPDRCYTDMSNCDRATTQECRQAQNPAASEAAAVRQAVDLLLPRQRRLEADRRAGHG